MMFLSKARICFALAVTMCLWNFSPALRAEEEANAPAGSGPEEGANIEITQELLKSIAENPREIASYIASASEEHVAELIIRTIAELQEMGQEDSAIQSKVGVMISETTRVRGASFGSAVMMRIRKKVNPRLLPVIPVGGVPSVPPSPSPKYPRQ